MSNPHRSFSIRLSKLHNNSIFKTKFNRSLEKNRPSASSIFSPTNSRSSCRSKLKTNLESPSKQSGKFFLTKEPQIVLETEPVKQIQKEYRRLPPLYLGYKLDETRRQRIVPSEALRKNTTLIDRVVIDHMKQQFISIYIRQKLKYEETMSKHGIKEELEDAQFKLFLSKLCNY